jgi:hypothetical protein
MALSHRLRRRALVRLAVLAALASLLSPIPAAEAQPVGGCLRFAGFSGYEATVVVIGGGGCRTVIRFKCRNDRARTWHIRSWQPVDVRTIGCLYPFQSIRASPR